MHFSSHLHFILYTGTIMEKSGLLEHWMRRYSLWERESWFRMGSYEDFLLPNICIARCKHNLIPPNLYVAQTLANFFLCGPTNNHHMTRTRTQKYAFLFFILGSKRCYPTVRESCVFNFLMTTVNPLPTLSSTS